MVNYYKSRIKAAEYTAMSEGYDGSEIIKTLKEFLKPESTVLELGMGPGKDIPLLEEQYKVTGSDISISFIEMYLEKNPEADLIELDAVKLNTERKFDCLYSNKVLQNLSHAELVQSFHRQYKILNSGGIICHSLWYGDKEIEVKGMRFVYYTEKTILKYVQKKFEPLYLQTYLEMETDDSLLIIMKKR